MASLIGPGPRVGPEAGGGPGPGVRRAGVADAGRVAEVLAAAFADDPVAAYIFPNASSRPTRLRRFFVLQLRHNYLPRGEVYLTGDGASAAMWLPPLAPAVRARDLVAHVRLVTLLGRRFFATRRLSILLATRHPRGEHYYLGTIGTEPAAQGQGLASALLVHVLARCDGRRIPAYLESSRPETVMFYGAHGCRVVDEVRAPGGGPPLWLMWRDPLG